MTSRIHLDRRIASGKFKSSARAGIFESLDRNLPAWTGICPLLSGHFDVHVDRNLPALFFLVSACPTFDLLVLFFKFARFFLNLPAFLNFPAYIDASLPAFLVMACPTSRVSAILQSPF